MRGIGGALAGIERSGRSCFSSLSGEEEPGSGKPAGGERKSNRLPHAGEQGKGTGDVTEVKFY